MTAPHYTYPHVFEISRPDRPSGIRLVARMGHEGQGPSPAPLATSVGRTADGPLSSRAPRLSAGRRSSSQPPG